MASNIQPLKSFVERPTIRLDQHTLMAVIQYLVTSELVGEYDTELQAKFEEKAVMLLCYFRDRKPTAVVFNNIRAVMDDVTKPIEATFMYDDGVNIRRQSTIITSYGS